MMKQQKSSNLILSFLFLIIFSEPCMGMESLSLLRIKSNLATLETYNFLQTKVENIDLLADDYDSINQIVSLNKLLVNHLKNEKDARGNIDRKEYSDQLKNFIDLVVKKIKQIENIYSISEEDIIKPVKNIKIFMPE